MWRRNVAYFVFVLTINISISQTQKNITFLDRWHQDSLVSNSSQVRYSGCWGFEFDGNEYAAIGSTEGTHFFRLGTEDLLFPCGFIEGRFNSPFVIHREIKTFRNYAYSICDEGSSSLQIIDLSYLPDSVYKVADIQNEDFGKVHNLFIDTANQLLYACLVTPIINGTEQSLIPLRVFSLANPLNPQLLWEGPSDIPEVHDCFVRDNIAILNCGNDGLRVYNFTNPIQPVYLSNLTFYQDQGYNHQGWLSPNGKTYLFADETSGKRIKKCSFSSNGDLVIQELFGHNYSQNSIPHNIMCTDEFAFVAYYNEGLRIYDLEPQAKEIAFYDTYWQDSPFKMNGAWGVYSNFKSGRIILSDRQNGLFLFHFNQSLFMNESTEEFSIYPNPVEKQNELIIRSPNDEISNFTLQIMDNFGKLIYKETSSEQSFLSIKANFLSGIYHCEFTYYNYLNDLQVSHSKLLVK